LQKAGKSQILDICLRAHVTLATALSKFLFGNLRNQFSVSFLPQTDTIFSIKMIILNPKKNSPWNFTFSRLKIPQNCSKKIADVCEKNIRGAQDLLID
jgi:hypothetical protein